MSREEQFSPCAHQPLEVYLAIRFGFRKPLCLKLSQVVQNFAHTYEIKYQMKPKSSLKHEMVVRCGGDNSVIECVHVQRGKSLLDALTSVLHVSVYTRTYQVCVVLARQSLTIIKSEDLESAAGADTE